MEESKSEKQKQKALEKALMSELKVDREELKKMKKKLLKASGIPERGIETWFRLTSKNLYTRLQIVDTKANILITSNSIIISIVLGSLYARLDEDYHLVYAVAGLLITNVISIAFSILAAIPQASKKAEELEELEKIDLMSFDDFYHMDIKEYESHVMKVMEDGNRLYPSIIADIHDLGLILARKYKLIRISFFVFLYGIIFSIMLFGVCHGFF